MQTDSKGAIAAIGTTLEIKSHVLLEDGRMGIETIGEHREVSYPLHIILTHRGGQQLLLGCKGTQLQGQSHFHRKGIAPQLCMRICRQGAL